MGITAGAGANSVAQWSDLSGKGNFVSQSTGSQQPIRNLADAAYNGKPTISFSRASSQFLRSAAWSITQPLTYFIVGQSSTNATETFIDWVTNEGAFYATSGTALNVFFASGFSATFNTQTPFVGCAAINGASSAIYANNSVTAVNTGTANGNTSGGILIGALQGGVSTLQGKLAEVIVYSGSLIASSRHQTMAYLGNRYGITVT